MLGKPEQIFEEGLVLHRRPYRETSMIVDFFTLKQGRVSAVVRGMRSAKSDKKSLLQPFQPLLFTLTGKSDLKTLANVEAKQRSFSLSGDALYCGFYMNEIVTRVLPQGLPVEDLYHSYVACINLLTEAAELDVVLRQFEFALLDELGVLPDLTHTQDDEIVEPDRFYRFQPGMGVLSALPGNGTFSGQVLLDVAAQHWHDDSRQLAKRICRHALMPILGDKPLHSRALFKRS